MDEEKQPEPHNLAAQPAVLRATIHITRKATGKTETYELVGTAPAEPPKEQQ